MFFWPKEPSPLGSELSLASVQITEPPSQPGKKKVNSSGILGASLQNSPITTTVGKLLDVEFLGIIGELLRIIEELVEKYVCLLLVNHLFIPG